MYEEIIGALKKCGYPGDVHYCRDCVFANHGGTCRMKKLLPAAADAIERLSNAGSAYGRGWTLGYDAGKEESKPRWIPVTERLPFAESGNVSEKVLVTDGKDVAIAEWFNFEMCEPFWSYTGMGDITHWMPLPQAPKEE